jgi:hypothetical protein
MSLPASTFALGPTSACFAKSDQELDQELIDRIIAVDESQGRVLSQ